MRPINRTQPAKPVMTVDEAVEADRRYFDVHPDENEYIRERDRRESRQPAVTGEQKRAHGTRSKRTTQPTQTPQQWIA